MADEGIQQAVNVPQALPGEGADAPADDGVSLGTESSAQSEIAMPVMDHQPAVDTKAMVDLGSSPSAEPDVEPPVARIYGEPLMQLPLDLYIPPDALAIMLEAFEGPLDLLLYLIRKQNVDILDIPMAPLTRQYLEYIDAMRSHNLELAAEYLVMAAMLIEIKSRLLLPRPKQEEGEEAGDPRAELVRRLIEYEQMKLAGQKLDAMPQADRDFQWVELWVEKSVAPRLPDVSIADLQRAWQGIMRQAKLDTHHRIKKEELSVREHMGMILRLLQTAKQTGAGFVEFSDMFEPVVGAPGVVVHFLAMLELGREHLIEITQVEAFAPIYVRIAEEETDVPIA